MLKGINKILTGDILKVLCDMGHGDELVIVDSNYPALTMGKRVITLPGIDAITFLDIIAPLFPLDHISKDSAIVLDVEPEDIELGIQTPQIWFDFEAIIKKEYGKDKYLSKLSRQEFYNRSRNAYAIIQTGEVRLYGDLILIKGVI